MRRRKYCYKRNNICRPCKRCAPHGVQYKWPCCRREAARCFVSVSSFNSKLRRAQSSVNLVTSASDLPLRTNKLCFVLFCSSWSSMLVVINKDSLMRGRLSGKLHGGRSQLLFALHLSSI